MVPPVSWVNAASCQLAFPSSHLLPASSHLLPFNVSAKPGAGGTSQAVGTGMEGRGDSRGRASPCCSSEVLCWVIPLEPSPATLMIYHWIIICVHWTYPFCSVMEKVLAPENWHQEASSDHRFTDG